MAEDDTPQSKLAAAREMLTRSKKPMTTENLNRASLALSQGKDTTDFSDKLEEAANPKPRGQARPAGKAPTPPPKEPPAAKPVEPAQKAAAVDQDTAAQKPGRGKGASAPSDELGMYLPGGKPQEPTTAAEAAAPPRGTLTPEQYVDDMIANESAGQNALLRSSGGAQAAPASTPPEPGFLPQPDAAPPSATPQGSFSDYLLQQGIMLPNGNLNMNSPAARDGSPAGMADTGLRAPRFPLARPPGFNGAPSPVLPPGSVNPPGASTLSGPAPQAALPSSYGPPASAAPPQYGPTLRGNPNSVPPMPPIAMQGGPSQAHLLGKPTMRVPAGSSRQQDNMIANTEALVRALRARGPGARPNDAPAPR